MTFEGIRAGCEELEIAVNRIKPKLHVFGHIHEGYGQIKLEGVHYVNACICNLSYKPINMPIVVDLPINTISVH